MWCGRTLAVNLGVIFLFSCSIAEAAVIGLLLYRRLWRTLPFFFAYNVWTLIGDGGGYAIFHSSPKLYTTTYIAVMTVDSVLEFGVLVELGWSALRPLRASLPRSALVAVAGLILALGAVIWPFAAIPAAANRSLEIGILGRLQQTFSILRVLVFVALAAGSQLLSIGWRDRELQIATGLGFTSLAGLAVAILHTHQATWAQYRNAYDFVVASSLCCMFYWVVCFSRKEAERREFTPQMQNFLLAMAGAARTTRQALEDSSPRKARKQKPM